MSEFDFLFFSYIYTFKKNSPGAKVFSATDRGKALKNADYVISTFQKCGKDTCHMATAFTRNISNAKSGQKFHSSSSVEKTVPCNAKEAVEDLKIARHYIALLNKEES